MQVLGKTLGMEIQQIYPRTMGPALKRLFKAIKRLFKAIKRLFKAI